MPYDSSNKMKGMPMKNHGMPMHSGAPHMESAKQERKNLMDDNPVARTAAGDRPWIAKHYKSGMNYGTPMNSGHSPMEMDSPVEGNAFTKAMKDAGGDYEKAKSMLKMDAKVVKKVYKKKQ